MRHFRHLGNRLIKEIHSSSKGSSFWSCSSLGHTSSSLPGAVSWGPSAPLLAFLPHVGAPCLTAVLPCLLCGLVGLSSPPITALSALALCSCALPSLGGKAELIYCDTWTHMEVPSGGSCCSWCKKRYAGLQGFFSFFFFFCCFFSSFFFFYFGFHETFNFFPSLRKQKQPFSNPSSTVVKLPQKSGDDPCFCPREQWLLLD